MDPVFALYLFGRRLLRAAVLFVAVGLGSSPAYPQQGQTCEQAFQSLMRVPVDKLPCTRPACLALYSVDAAIAKITDLVTSHSAPADAKKEAIELLKDLETRRTTLKEKLKPLGMFGDTDPGQLDEWTKSLANAQLICEQLSDKLKSSMAAQLAFADKAREYAVCKDKHVRLPDFLKRYFALNERDPMKGAPGKLQVLRARYGDVFNEDRDYRHLTPSLRRRRGGLEVATPRAGLGFTDPEDFGSPADEALWDQHRHTCDVTWYFRRQCVPRAFSKVDATWSGNAYCLMSITEDKTTVDTVMCGHDPSPQGNKQFHVRFACGNKIIERKFPGSTRRIHLICDPAEQDDLVAETDYFLAEPCPADVGGVAAKLKAELEKLKKQSDAQKQADANPASKTGDGKTGDGKPDGSGSGGGKDKAGGNK